MLSGEKKKSSFSGWRDDIENKDCVEARINGGGNVEVTHSRCPERDPQVFTANEWRAFVAGVKAGEFDLLSGD